MKRRAFDHGWSIKIMNWVSECWCGCVKWQSAKVSCYRIERKRTKEEEEEEETTMLDDVPTFKDLPRCLDELSIFYSPTSTCSQYEYACFGLPLFSLFLYSFLFFRLLQSCVCAPGSLEVTYAEWLSADTICSILFFLRFVFDDHGELASFFFVGIFFCRWSYSSYFLYLCPCPFAWHLIAEIYTEKKNRMKWWFITEMPWNKEKIGAGCCSCCRAYCLRWGWVDAQPHQEEAVEK